LGWRELSVKGKKERWARSVEVAGEFLFCKIPQGLLRIGAFISTYWEIGGVSRRFYLVARDRWLSARVALIALTRVAKIFTSSKPRTLWDGGSANAEYYLEQAEAEVFRVVRTREDLRKGLSWKNNSKACCSGRGYNSQFPKLDITSELKVLGSKKQPPQREKRLG